MRHIQINRTGVPINRYSKILIGKTFLSPIVGILLILVISPLFVSVFDLKPEEVIYPLCLLMIAITIWIALTIRQVTPDYFSLYSLFIVAAILFNGGQAFLEVFNFNKVGMLNDRFDPMTLSLTLYMVILSLASFHTGGLLCATKKKRTPPIMPCNKNHLSISEESLRIVGIGLLIISAFPAFLMTLDTFKKVMQFGYFELFQQFRNLGMESGMEGLIYNLSHFYIPGLLFLFCGSKRYLIIRGVIIAALISYVCVLLFLGRRGHGAEVLLAGLWTWHMIVRPISIRKLFIIAALLLFFIFPTIQTVRNIEGASRITFQFFLNAYLSIDSPMIVAIHEMGGSMETIAHTLELIPDTRPFFWGATYGYAASSIIPNFFWELHPAVEYGSLARWLTTTVDPYIFYLGGGLGYSFIAESYANFGWFGTPLALGLIGFLIAKISIWPYENRGYAKVAVVAVCIANILFWVRGDASLILRPLFYSALIPYFFFRIIKGGLIRKYYAQERR